MRKLLAVIGILGLVGGVLLLTGCDSPAAQRERAQAERIRAEAQAYQQKKQADTEAASERANIRQMERDASHQRTMELLPFVLLIVGGLLLAGLGGLIFWDLRRQAALTVDPRLLACLEHLQLQQTEGDRQLWRALASIQRRSLPAGSQEVIIYEQGKERRRWD